MRFISRHPKYRLTVRQHVEEPTPFGPKIIQQGIIASFQQGGLTDKDREHALSSFSPRGLPDQNLPGTPGFDKYFSIYDTDLEASLKGWDEDTKEKVEKFMTNYRPAFGREYILVEQPRLERPWPTYEDLDAEDIPRTVELLGLNPADVVAYERENRNRETLIAELELLLEPVGEVPA